jgi:hypothetical protein
MMAGRKPMGLIPYASKLEPDTKAVLEALVQVQNMKGGQRELINDMLVVYKDAKPEAFERADQFIKFTSEIKKDAGKQE